MPFGTAPGHSPDFEEHRTCLLLNPDAFARARGGETLVVCGAARGMTSLAAFALTELGFPLGDTLGENNHEDQDFLQALPETQRRRRVWWPHGALDRIVAARNARHARWGFKLPRAIFYAPVLKRRLRRPVFMVCVRNPLGTLGSIRRREPDKTLKFAQLYRRATSWQRGMDWVVTQPDLPVILLDMDRAKAQPGRFLNDLVGLFDLDGDLRRIKGEIRRAGYSRRGGPEAEAAG